MSALLIRPGAAPGPGGPPQPAQQSKRLQQTQAQVDEVLDPLALVTTVFLSICSQVAVGQTTHPQDLA